MAVKYLFIFEKIHVQKATEKQGKACRHKNCRLIERTLPSCPPKEGEERQQKTC